MAAGGFHASERRLPDHFVQGLQQGVGDGQGVAAQHHGSRADGFAAGGLGSASSKRSRFMLMMFSMPPRGLRRAPLVASRPGCDYSKDSTGSSEMNQTDRRCQTLAPGSLS